MTTNLNKYQDLDGKVIKIENDLKKTDERKKLMKVKVFLDEVDQTLHKMEQRAGELYGSFNGCERRISDLVDEIHEYEGMTLEGSDESEVNYLQTKTQKLRDQIRGIEKDGETIVSEIEKLTREFDAFKEKVSVAKKEFAVNKEKFEAVRGKVKPEVDAIKAEMKSLESEIDDKFMEMYKKGRKEKLYPVFVPLVSGNCGGCGMDLALSIKSEIEINGLTKCEHCGKIIYKV
ncbi:MAG: hypothetical protein R3Y32_06425 [Bacillota bacterium]